MEPKTIETNNNTKHYYLYRNTALELNRKSLMVEEAVEEVLDLVKKAAQQFNNDNMSAEFDFMMEEGGNFIYYFLNVTYRYCILEMN